MPVSDTMSEMVALAFALAGAGWDKLAGGGGGTTPSQTTGGGAMLAGGALIGYIPALGMCGGGAGVAGVVQGQGQLPGGGGKPLAFASAVHNDTAGFALDGKPDFALVPANDPAGNDDCMPTM
jgi:hypothetical protein